VDNKYVLSFFVNVSIDSDKVRSSMERLIHVTRANTAVSAAKLRVTMFSYYSTLLTFMRQLCRRRSKLQIGGLVCPSVCHTGFKFKNGKLQKCS